MAVSDPYKISLELYTSDRDVAASNYRECLSLFQPRNHWGNFRYKTQLSLRYADPGPCINLGDARSEQPRYLVLLPKKPDQKVFWMLLDAANSDCLSDGQTFGFWRTNDAEDGRPVHTFHACDGSQEQQQPSYFCG